MITPPKKNPTPRIKRGAQLKWSRGIVSSGGRPETPQDGLYTADNVVISKEGSVVSRSPFGVSDIPNLPSENFIGPIFSFWNPKTSEFDVLAVCNGFLYMLEPGSNWVKVSETVTFSTTNMCAFSQYGNFIAIADGEHALAYFIVPMDGVVASLSRPGSAIPANPSMAITDETTPAITTSDYRAYYLVSYVNNYGETPASGGGPFTVDAKYAQVKLADSDKPLGLWANTLKVAITDVDTALPSDTRVRIYRVLTPAYIAPATTNFSLVKEFLVSSGNQTFEDNGAVTGQVIAPQLENSTGGLVARYVTEIDGRLWAFGAGKERQKIYYTGAAPTSSMYPQFFAGDGGYFYVAYGSSYEPVTIKRGRSDDGQICNFCLCSGPNGAGRRFNIFPLSTTYGDQNVFQYYPSEQKGDEGAYSTFGVLDYMNSILYPSPGGFKSSGVRAEYTSDNITAEIDVNIRDAIRKIPYSVFRTMYGSVYDGKALWHISPTAILVFDMVAGGAWTKWYIAHSWFGAVSFGSDRSSLHLVSGAKVLRYVDSDEFKTADSVPLSTPLVAESGRIVVAPNDDREWIRLLNCLFVFSDISGPIKITLRANSRKRLETYTGTVVVNRDVFSAPYSVGSEPVPFGKEVVDSDGAVEGPFGSRSSWSDGPFTLVGSSSAGMAEVRLRVNKDINFLDWRIESLQGFISMKLDSFVFEYVDIGVGLDFSSRYNEVRLKTERS